MEPTLRQLRAFRAVAEETHFGRAAERLVLAQPTVSKEIRLLEQSLGARLFHRGSGGTRLTERGRALLPHAQQAVSHVEQLLTHANTSAAGLVGDVRIAATPSIVNRLVPAALRLLDTAQPHLEVTVLETETGGIPNVVQSRKADLGLGHHIRPIDGCRLHTMGQDELYVVVRADLVPHADSAIDLTALRDVPLLSWPREQNPGYYDALLLTCQRRGLDPLIVTGSSRLSGARSYLLRDGRAFALVPRDFAMLEKPPLRAAPLAEPAMLPLECLCRMPAGPGVREVIAAVERSR